MTEWITGTLTQSFLLTNDIKSLTFNVPGIKRHIPGQYYSFRLINAKGHIAERIYSAAQVPNNKGIVEIGVQIIPHGELSPFLFSMKEGSSIEIKGPSGVYFNFDEKATTPFLFVCGGVGVVPFMSMIRAAKRRKDITLLGSFQSDKCVPYRKEILGLLKDRCHLTFTRQSPSNWSGFTRRIDIAMINQIYPSQMMQKATIYICGSSNFVEDMSELFIKIGVSNQRIKTEYFG